MRQRQHLVAAYLLMTVAGRGGHRLGRPRLDPRSTRLRLVVSTGPRDHWAREGYKTEWWYFTGHLRTAEEPVRRFGYQFTFFRIGMSQDAPGPAPPGPPRISSWAMSS